MRVTTISVRIVSTSRRCRSPGRQRSISSATHRSRSRSRPIAASIPGRSTLTATGSPSVVTAKCTCAIEAAATGSSSKLANSSTIGRPRSASTIARASSAGNGGSRSCSISRSRATAGPIRSSRTASDCPSLMNAGPSSLSALASRSPGVPGTPRAAASSAPRSTARGKGMSASGNRASWRASIRAEARSRQALRVLRSIRSGMVGTRPRQALLPRSLPPVLKLVKPCRLDLEGSAHARL